MIIIIYFFPGWMDLDALQPMVLFYHCSTLEGEQRLGGLTYKRPFPGEYEWEEWYMGQTFETLKWITFFDKRSIFILNNVQ